MRFPSSAHTCRLVPSGFLAGVRTCRPEPGPWSWAADGCCVTARPARRGPSRPARSGYERGHRLQLPGQLPGAGPWRHPGRGVGHAGSRRRHHEEILHGAAGRTAPVLQLCKPAASKLTILLQPCLSAPHQRRPTQARPAPPDDRPSLHVALEGRRRAASPKYGPERGQPTAEDRAATGPTREADDHDSAERGWPDGRGATRIDQDRPQT
jgi:hypothetical protein